MTKPDLLEGKPGSTLEGLLTGEAFSNAIRKVLPKYLPPDRFVQIARSAVKRPPAYDGAPTLKDCEPTSFFGCLMDLGNVGLAPDGRNAHLIPFRNRKAGSVDCQLIIDYKGLVTLIKRNGVPVVYAHVVHENDEFSEVLGSDMKLLHKPTLVDRGKPIAVYAYWRDGQGNDDWETLTEEDVLKIRNSAKGYNPQKPSGPWKEWPLEMWKKSALRRLSKRMDISPQSVRVIDREDGEAIDIDSEVLDGMSLPKAVRPSLPEPNRGPTIDEALRAAAHQQPEKVQAKPRRKRRTKAEIERDARLDEEKLTLRREAIHERDDGSVPDDELPPEIRNQGTEDELAEAQKRLEKRRDAEDAPTQGHLAETAREEKEEPTGVALPLNEYTLRKKISVAGIAEADFLEFAISRGWMPGMARQDPEAFAWGDNPTAVQCREMAANNWSVIEEGLLR